VTPLLDIRGLSVTVAGPPEKAIVSDVGVSLDAGEIVGLIGESGAGKSTTARTVLGLWPRAARVDGQVLCGGEDVLRMGPAELRRHRVSRVGAIFQDPRASVNAMHRIDHFVLESMCVNHGMRRADARARALELLESVGLDGRQVLRSYPHELSGGMLQRVVIATALTGEPEILVADEPTTALDVTSQAEVIAILQRLRRERNLAILLVTHNLELAGAVCDRIAVMRNGAVVEAGEASVLLHEPAEPYTRELLEATLGVAGRGGSR
jgi:peptide/nickel transport system ATP-binding protein